MPVLKHAKKKLRQDKVRTARNKKLKDEFKKLVKEVRAKKTAESLSKAFSSIDKATKHYILHKNTAARMKSALSKVVDGKAPAVVKEAVKKVEKQVEKAVAEVDKEVKKAVVKANKDAKKAVVKATKKAAPKKK